MAVKFGMVAMKNALEKVGGSGMLSDGIGKMLRRKVGQKSPTFRVVRASLSQPALFGLGQ